MNRRRVRGVEIQLFNFSSISSVTSITEMFPGGSMKRIIPYWDVNITSLTCSSSVSWFVFGTKRAVSLLRARMIFQSPSDSPRTGNQFERGVSPVEIPARSWRTILDYHSLSLLSNFEWIFLYFLYNPHMLQNKYHNIAFIDGQNLYMGSEFQIDFKKMRTYLKDKYSVEKAYYFVGFR